MEKHISELKNRLGDTVQTYDYVWNVLLPALEKPKVKKKLKKE